MKEIYRNQLRLVLSYENSLSSLYQDRKKIRDNYKGKYSQISIDELNHRIKILEG